VNWVADRFSYPSRGQKSASEIVLNSFILFRPGNRRIKRWRLGLFAGGRAKTEIRKRLRWLTAPRIPRLAIVFHVQGCGLANRLRALVGYQALATLRKVPFYLCWRSDPACPCRFEDLFQTQMNFLKPHDLERCGPDVSIVHEAAWFDEIWRCSGQAFEWPAYLEEVHRCLRALIPRPQVQRIVNEFASRHDLYHALGVHIRNTDNLAMYAKFTAGPPNFDNHRISSLDGFLDVIRAGIVNRPVFLATDDPALERRLLETFPALTVLAKQYMSGQRPTEVTIALAEMLVLGRCEQIVGTYYSSYSKWSALWGRRPYFEVIGQGCERCDFVDRMLAVFPPS